MVRSKVAHSGAMLINPRPPRSLARHAITRTRAHKPPIMHITTTSCFIHASQTRYDSHTRLRYEAFIISPLHPRLCAYTWNTYVGLIASSLSLGELWETVGTFCVTLTILMALFRRNTDNHNEEYEPNDGISLLMTTSKPRSVAQVV